MSDVIAVTVIIAGGLRLTEKRYPAALRMAPHAHDEWRYCLAVHGEYTDSWRRALRRREPRQVSLHPAGETHTTIFHGDTVCFHIEFADAWRDRLLGEAAIPPEPHEFLKGTVPAIAMRIREEFFLRDAASALVLEGLACELAGWSGRAIARETPGASWVYRARDMVRDQFLEPFTLARLAAEVGVHPVHLARQFRRTFGCSVGEYVRAARISVAQRALATSASLSDVALSAGFADQSHFTRVFKRATGLTPRAFRLLHVGDRRQR